MSSTDNTIVIVGAGIIGCATAYYLSRKDSDSNPKHIHIIETSSALFSSASGKAGGFLAEDWFAPEVSSLGSLSFRLHRELAEEYDGYHRWGYSQSTGSSLVSSGSRDGRRGEDWLRNGGSRANAATAAVDVHGSVKLGKDAGAKEPAWLTRRDGDQMETIGEEGSVAQVDPLRLSQFLLDKSIEAGVTLHQPAEVIHLASCQNGRKTSSLTLRRHSKASLQNGDSGTTDYTIPCTQLLLASGAWTPSVFQKLFPHSNFSIPISPLAGHSIVVRSPLLRTAADSKPSCHAIFTTLHKSAFSPEIFSRVGDEIYIAGLNSSSIPLPDRAENAHVDERCIEKLIDVARDLIKSDTATVERNASGETDRALVAAKRGDVEVVRQGLCFRPVTHRGLPVLTKVDEALLSRGDTIDENLAAVNVFVAAGHGPWGISQSLGTGLVMAEMLQGKVETSADVSQLGF